jgi:renalase
MPVNPVADETWVLHATRKWSATQLETDTAQIAQLMTDAFQRVIGTSVEPVRSVAHRWKYALPDPVVPDAALFDAALGLGAAGDWCGGPRVEGALLSGVALAGRVLTHAHGAAG